MPVFSAWCPSGRTVSAVEIGSSIIARRMITVQTHVLPRVQPAPTYARRAGMDVMAYGDVAHAVFPEWHALPRPEPNACVSECPPCVNSEVTGGRSRE
jgi:hypothetical protein